MSRKYWMPGDTLADYPGQPLSVSRIIDDWVPIHGLPADGSCRNNQLVFFGEGRRFLRDLRKGAGLVWHLSHHLGFAPGGWNRRLFLRYAFEPFLHQHRSWMISIQVIPRRKPFRAIEGAKDERPSQSVFDVIPCYDANHMASQHVELAEGLSIPGDMLVMASEADHGKSGRADRQMLMKAKVTRKIPGTPHNRETWFFLAREGSDGHFRRSVSIPALERLRGVGSEVPIDMVEVPLVMAIAISPDLRWVSTLSFDFDPNSGKVVDIRQSRPSFRHHMLSGRHNHYALHRLAYNLPPSCRN